MRSLSALLRDGRSAAGLAVLAALLGLALLAPALTPLDPLAQQDVMLNRFLAPLQTGADGVRHWLGTDALGRDVFARLAYGARISLAVGLLSAAVSVGVGVATGVVAAMAGGVADRALMAVTDGVLALPRIVLLLALVTLWDQSLILTVLVIGFTGWMTVARLTRAEVRSVLRRPYVESARTAGADPWRLLTHHVLPNALTPILVAAALGVGNAIMLESGLSFLGLGVPAPAPSWGNMIAGGRDALVNAPWIAIVPGMAVAMATIGCNLVADGLRDVLDPTTRGVH